MERIEINGISIEALIAGTGPPLLFLHGGDYVAQNRAFLDRLAQRFHVVAPSYGENLAAALPSARFERIPGAAHYPQIEHPEAVADHIARFVQENRP